MVKTKIDAYQEAEVGFKKVLAVVKSQNLIHGLEEMVKKESAQLQLARPNTPDLFILPANVKIVNRTYLGLESWQFYCERLKERYDYLENITPLIIVDEKAGDVYENLQVAGKAIKYIRQKEAILKTAQDFLKKSEMDCRGVRAVDNNKFSMEGCK